MKKFVLLPFFFIACAKVASSPPKNLPQKVACQNWDTSIDGPEEFLCAIQHAAEGSHLHLQSSSFVFEEPLIFSTSLKISGGKNILSAPSMRFDKIVNIDTIHLRAEDIQLNASARFVDVQIDAKVNFKGPHFFVKDSIFERKLVVDAVRFQIVGNRFNNEVNLKARENAYANGNLFLSSEESTFQGSLLFVENNCRQPNQIWKGDAQLSKNLTSVSCQLKTWCASDNKFSLSAFDRTRLKIGDFDGNGLDDLVRIEERSWHRYDFKKQEWSFLRFDDNTPPWAIGVADLNGDGKEELIKADGYLIRSLSEDGKTWVDGPMFEEGFARQYLMVGQIEGDEKSEFLKLDRKSGKIYASKNSAVDWKEITKVESAFKDIVLRDINNDGFDDLIVSKSKGKLVYDFTKKAWSKLKADAKQKARFSVNGNDFQVCPTQKKTKRLASYNVNHAGVRSVEELAESIKNIDADFLVLQEVDRNTKRNPYDMAKILSELTGYPYFEFFKSNEYQGGEYGLMALSKTPIQNVKTLRLPAHKNTKEWPEKNIAISLKTNGETFILTHVIARKWKHGQDLSKTQDAQIDSLIEFVQKEKADFVIGDFNIRPESSAYKRFLESTGYFDSYSFSTQSPTFPDIHGEARRIDYIFTKQDLRSSTRSEIPTWILSDHYPYILNW